MRRNFCKLNDFAPRIVIFDYCIHNRRYIEDVWIRRCVLALIFANAFEIAKFTRLKMCSKFLLHSNIRIIR